MHKAQDRVVRKLFNSYCFGSVAGPDGPFPMAENSGDADPILAVEFSLDSER